MIVENDLVLFVVAAVALCALQVEGLLPDKAPVLHLQGGFELAWDPFHFIGFIFGFQKREVIGLKLAWEPFHFFFGF